MQPELDDAYNGIQPKADFAPCGVFLNLNPNYWPLNIRNHCGRLMVVAAVYIWNMIKQDAEDGG